MTNKQKLLLLAAAGATVAVLLSTKKGRKLTQDLADNANGWKDSLVKLAGKYGDKLTSIRDMVNNEVEGLSSDAREKINAILDEGTSSAKKVKRKVGNQLS
jgi:hypothetical protein